MKDDLRARARLRESDPDNSWERHRLPSGLTVVLEQVPTVPSLAIGLWVKSGTRDETDALAGVAHFVEHLVFKGTRTRSTFDIAKSLESVGGELDAFTGRESTCFYARVLEQHLPLAVDVLADLTCHPLLSSAEVEKEKKVILDEIHSFDDNPEDVVQETFSAEMWQGHPLGRPILGTESSVASLTAAAIRSWYAQHYTTDNMLVSVAGSFDPDEVLRLLERHVTAPRGQAPRRADPMPPATAGLRRSVKDLSQEQVVLGVPTVSYLHADRFAVNLLATLLGGGMSSRLFQAIREREGLSYSVYSFADFFADAGVFGSALGCAPGEAQRALEVLWLEYVRLREHGPEPGELESAREQAKGGLLMGLESMSSRMSRLARSEMYLGRRVSVEETVANLQRVTDADLVRLIDTHLDPATTLVTALGPCDTLQWRGRP